MIKVLYLPLNTPDFTQNGMIDAFNHFNVNLKIFDYNLMHIKGLNKNQISKNLLNIVEEFKPDLMHCQLQFSNIIENKTILKIKEISKNTKISNWTGDIRKEVPNEFIINSQAIDYNLISSSGQIDLYSKKCNKKIYYWQIGLDPKLYFPKHNKDFLCKSIFIGNNWKTSDFPGGPQRVKILKSLKETFKEDFHIYGYGWESEELTSKGVLKLSELNNYYNNSLSCISVSNFNNVSHYFSDRLLISMASGRPVVCLAFPGWEDYFIDNEDILIAKNIEDVKEKVKWITNNESKAEKIGMNGYLKIINEHSYTSRVLELFKIVGIL